MNRRRYATILLGLALPAMAEQFLQSLVGFVDMAFISKIGIDEVAAVGITNSILQIYFAFFLAISVAVSIMVSRQHGAGDADSAKRIAHQAIWVTGFLGVSIGLASFFFAESLFGWLGAEQRVVDRGLIYFRIVTVPSVLVAMLFTIGAIFKGHGDTKTPLKVGLWMNAIHIILDYVLIFGVLFEGFGIIGAAIATVLARLFGIGMYGYSLYRRDYVSKRRRDWSLRLDDIVALSRLGIPVGIERLAMRLGQIIYFGMIVRLGTDVYAAHTLAGNFTIFVTVIGSGLAVATTTLVGQQIGANQFEEATKYVRTSIMLSVILMTTMSLLVWLASPFVAGLLIEERAVINLITLALAIDIIAQPATASVLSLTAALQAGGDTKFPMYVTLLGIWAIRVVGVYVLAVSLQFGLAGVWAAIAIDNYVRAGILFKRYRRGNWIRQLS
ncbi:MATE family efflux transporter [Exiguobacterium sp.]|uniref:MATE family efflux transporter n=1 Tax=Exiguobacterium sp. TaxID=44751 RepID=UPI00391D61FC